MARSHIAAAALAAIASLVSVSSTRADELPDDKMSPYQFSGVINADNVYVRSYSSENDYPVIKLSKGDAVVVVGSRFDYLKILPPAGAYCLVGKAWVEVRGDGSVGRVREEAANNANVRIASTLNPQSYGKVVTQAKPNSDVKILGQQDEYFKIAPPAGAFVYVHKRFVDLVKRVDVVEDSNTLIVKQLNDQQTSNITPPKPPAPTPPDKVVTPPTADNADNGLKPVPPIPSPTPDNSNNATPPANPANTTEPSTEPATPPAAKTDTAGFADLEKKFKSATELPLAQQPLDDLLAGYQKVVDEKTLPEPTLKLAEYRLTGLKLRKEAADTLAGKDDEEKKRQSAQTSLTAEAKEIQDRMAANDFKRYAAVGTLRTSALPFNGKALYRLTDPASGRTVIYVTDATGNLSTYDGQFVGIKGAITQDTVRQIKVISPQSIDSVDPADITKGTVTSTLVPPSLVSQGK